MRRYSYSIWFYYMLTLEGVYSPSRRAIFLFFFFSNNSFTLYEIPNEYRLFLLLSRLSLLAALKDSANYYPRLDETAENPRRFGSLYVFFFSAIHKIFEIRINNK